MTIEIDSERISGGRLQIFNKAITAVFLTAEAIDDISDAIVNQAKEEAPMGETGELKAHPVEVSHVGIGRIGTPGLARGEIVTEFPSFGGGLTVRGAGGRFVKGGITEFEPGTRGIPSLPGDDFEKVVIKVPSFPRHAIWVHNGTGIYGPRHSPIVPRRKDFLVFKFKDGKTFRGKFVKGQKPNPYLENAFVIINRTYIPARVERLRLEIRELP